MKKFNHEKELITEALGIPTEEFEGIREIVKDECMKQGKISELIINTIASLKSTEFDIPNVEISSLSDYEIKLILAGVAIEKATSTIRMFEIQ